MKTHLLAAAVCTAFFLCGTFYHEPVALAVACVLFAAAGMGVSKLQNGHFTGLRMREGEPLLLGNLIVGAGKLTSDVTLPVYIEALEGFAPMTGMFIARLEGQHVLIIESVTKETV